MAQFQYGQKGQGGIALWPGVVAIGELLVGQWAAGGTPNLVEGTSSFVVPTPSGGGAQVLGQLPGGVLVTGAVFYVTTAEATGTTKTVNIGTASDADGFFAARAVAATGFDALGAGALVGKEGSASAENVTLTPGSADFAELTGQLWISWLRTA